MLYSNIKSRETRGKYIETYMYIYVCLFVCLWCKKVVLLLKHRDRTIVECYLENRMGTLADRNVKHLCKWTLGVWVMYTESRSSLNSQVIIGATSAVTPKSWLYLCYAR